MPRKAISTPAASAGFDEYLAKSDQTRLPENLARALRLAATNREANDNQRRAS